MSDVALSERTLADMIQEAIALQGQLEATAERLSRVLGRIDRMQAQLDSVRASAAAEKAALEKSAAVQSARTASPAPERVRERESRPTRNFTQPRPRPLSQRDPEIARRWAALKFA